MSGDAPGQLGGSRLERLTKPELYVYARQSPACRCGRARVMDVILGRADRKQAKRAAKVIDLREAA